MDPKDEALPKSLIHAILAASSVVAGAMPRPGLRGEVLAAIGPQPGMTMVRAGEGEWKQIAPGVEAKVLHEGPRSCTWLARMRAGASLPAHPHFGDEECLVLEGSVEADGMTASAGDYQISFAGTRHGEARSPGGCLLLLRSAYA